MDLTILILSGGGPPPTTQLPQSDMVIAADSGLGLAQELGLDVDLIVGDLDSVDHHQLETAIAAGVDVESHPADKDATDLDLAIQAASDRGATKIVVAGGGAGRIDHLLGSAMLLADERWASTAIEWHPGSSVVHVVRGHMVLDTATGDLVSIVPVSDDAVVSVIGSRWALTNVPLSRGSSRGISNESLGSQVRVDVTVGVVLAVVTRSEP